MGEVITDFIVQIESLVTSLPLAIRAIQAAHRTAHKTYDEFVAKNCTEEKRDGVIYVGVPSEHDDRYNVLSKRLKKTSTAYSVVPRSFLVALISAYDAFLGQLVSALFRSKPEMLKSSDRALTFSQLSEFESIAAAREHILEKEVETLLRKSHTEQFDWLENKFSLKLRVDLPVWPTFIEVTERRNLFVHSDGVVSSQYLKICREHGVKIDSEMRPGTRLEVPYSYFRSAYEAVFQIGVKLGQVLWRKLNPTDLQTADSSLSSVCYELIKEQKYALSQVMLDFACCNPMKHADERARLVFLVNRAQSYKWGGYSDKALEVIGSQDWSATAPVFQLAAAVLRDEYEQAIEHMERIGSTGEPSKADYRTWPLFREIRKNAKFVQKFEEIFEEPFDLATTVEKPVSQPSEGPPTGGSEEPPATIQ